MPNNITNIPAPRVPFIDDRTGLMAREWYRFFLNLFQLTGSGQSTSSLEDLQVAPVSQDILGELGIVYDQSQLASMMAQYEQAARDLQNQIDNAPSLPQLGTLAAINEDNVRLLGFNTNPSPAVPNPAPTGTLYWDGNSTLGLQMDQGVLAKIGQSQFTYVKASSAITKGQLCKHTGAVGGSGVIAVAPTTTGMTDANQIVGVAAEDIALNAFGFIQDSGDLRGFNTTGASVGETWADGDPLYYNPSFVGGLTKVKPSAPNLKSYVGEVINASSGGSGSIHVRMSPGSVLGGTDSNVQFGTLSDKDLIQYDSTALYWKNVSFSSISVGTATNLSGGAAGSVPYQTGAGTTTFLSLGTAAQVLQVNPGATAPEWVNSTGTGDVVRATSPTIATPTITTSATVPLVIGGTGTTSTLTLRSTSGVGTTGADIVFQTGNNGATEAMRAVNNGNIGMGIAVPTGNSSKLLHVHGTTSELHLTSTATGTTSTDGLCIQMWSDSVVYFIQRENAAIEFWTNNTKRVSLSSGGNFLVVGSGGLGYGTGSGGAVTQATSRTTGVTLDKTNGAITLVSAAGSATYQSFTVTNNTVAATDTIIVNQKSGTDKYIILVTNVAAGSFQITYATTGGTTTEQPVFNFAVIKAVTA
jgi:hypothetical protein